MLCSARLEASSGLDKSRHILHIAMLVRLKGGDLTQPYEKKAPTPTEISKGQSDNTNNATKKSIKQGLRTDLGRSLGVTTATQLVW